MGPELLNAILVTKLAMKANGEDYRRKKVTAENIDLHKIYGFKNVDDKQEVTNEQQVYNKFINIYILRPGVG